MTSYKSFAGIKNTVPTERLGEGDLVAADNVVIDASGRLSRREGRSLALAGNYHSLYSAGNVCLLVGGSTLYRVTESYALENLRTGLTLNAPMAYEEVSGRIYYSNGHETGVIDSSVSRTWGIVPPVHQGRATRIAGELSAGVYQWAITFIRQDGQESGTGIAGRIELEGQSGIAFSELPVSSDAGVVCRNLYLSAANGSVLYEAITLDATSAEASVISDADQSRPLETQFLSPPPAGQALIFFNGTLFVAVDDLLYPSEPMAYELFDLRSYIPLDGRITLLASVEGGLVVSAGNTTGFLRGSQPDEFVWVERNTDSAIPGTLSYVSGKHLGDGAMGDSEVPVWLSSSGICMATPDGQVRNLTSQRFTMSESGQGAALFNAQSARYVAVVNR